MNKYSARRHVHTDPSLTAVMQVFPVLPDFGGVYTFDKTTDSTYSGWMLRTLKKQVKEAVCGLCIPAGCFSRKRALWAHTKTPVILCI